MACLTIAPDALACVPRVSQLRLFFEHRSPQDTWKLLTVCGMVVGLDVTVALYLPDPGVGVGRSERLGVLEGYHLVVGRMEKQQRHAFLRELRGILLGYENYR